MGFAGAPPGQQPRLPPPPGAPPAVPAAPRPDWSKVAPTAPSAPPTNAGMAGGSPHDIGTPPGPTTPGALSGPGFGEQYGMSHVGQYDTPTAMETFAQQQMNGNNPYYARLQQQGSDAINQQMAARGHYNSGGALSALGNYSGALGAAQFKDMGDLLGQAGTLGLNRMGQGQSVANGVQSQQQNRLGQQWGEASDMAHLQAGLVGGFYGQGGNQSGDAAMAGINAGANSAALSGKGQDAFGQQVWGFLGNALGK